jgi:GNAT superfamily N-acetyltransferase
MSKGSSGGGAGPVGSPADKYQYSAPIRPNVPELEKNGFKPNQMIVVHDKGKQIAKVEFEVDGKVIYIGEVFVEPEYRRQGIATKMYKQILKHNKGSKFGPNTRTPDGKAFRKTFNKRNPKIVTEKT